MEQTQTQETNGIVILNYPAYIWVAWTWVPPASFIIIWFRYVILGEPYAIL